jgi:hypothetical protein
MAEPILVSIPDLRSALVRVLDATETLLGSEVGVGSDYYWHVPVEDAFDLANEPQTFTVGQLSDDVKTLHEQSDAVPEGASHDLSHLVGVLRALELTAKA